MKKVGSPVNISFKSFVKIDRRKEDAVYMQLVFQFINAVKTRILEDGDRLPGSRKLAEDLKLHRKTIVAALEELQEQGWVKTIPNIGTFVQHPTRSPGKGPNSKAFQHPPEKAIYPFRKEFILDTPMEEQQEQLFFTDGTPDYGIVKVEELVRFYASVLRRSKQNRDLQDTLDGNRFFRDQLAYYLNISRGFHLSRNYLLPIGGREQVFSILSRLLISQGDIILVEALSYYLPNMIFGQAGAQLKTVPVDEEGMDIDFIRRQFRPGDLRGVYINPRCQYPTGVPLSEQRKQQLLELAEDYDFIVIEDDADFEFSSHKEKGESLFKMDAGKRVIYTGGFGRFLTPGFQMHFLIAPKDLLEEGRKYLNLFGKPNFMMERALGEIIHQGEIQRYQRKSHKLIGERKESFATLLRLHFQDEIAFALPAAGLAFWIRFKKSISLTRLQEKALQKGVLVPSICLYQNRNLSALRLGFAHLNLQDMEEALRLLAEAYWEIGASAT